MEKYKVICHIKRKTLKGLTKVNQSKLQKIYLELPYPLVTPIYSFKDLIKWGYSSKADRYYLSDNFVSSYYDRELTKLQCKEARRSFEDLLSICNTYFPPVTEYQLAKHLYSLNKKYIKLMYCPTIRKIVFKRDDIPRKFELGPGDIRRDKNNFKGNGQYTYNQIMALIKA